MENTNKTTSLMLKGGLIAGPIYILVGLFQILTREGFDISRHPLSFMALGDLGWIQISNFIITGLLTLMAAIALRRLAGDDKRWRRAATILGLYGLFVVGGGIFLPDPALGFPPGTPDAYPETFTTHGLLHFLFGMAAFLSLIIAGIYYGRLFSAADVPSWARFSFLTGGLMLVAQIAGFASGNSAWGLILLYIAVGLGWVWISLMSRRALQSLKS